jgi:hypothetical protein
LELSRLVGPKKGEANFNIFYQLCQSAEDSNGIAAKFGLKDAKNYFYLSKVLFFKKSEFISKILEQKLGRGKAKIQRNRPSPFTDRFFHGTKGGLLQALRGHSAHWESVFRAGKSGSNFGCSFGF